MWGIPLEDYEILAYSIPNLIITLTDILFNHIYL